MPGYWIVKGGEVKNPAALKAYNELFAVIAQRYKAEIIAGRERVETVEGRAFPRQFILRFDSFETAKACYEDPDYQASLELATQAYDRELSILEGGKPPAIAETDPPGQQELSTIGSTAWSELQQAAEFSDASLRYLSLCTVDEHNKPQVRLVVLRRVDAAGKFLEFHTDVRSAKWRELEANPNVSVLGYCPKTRLQLRLKGKVQLHAPQSATADRAWRQLSNYQRATYTGGAPGDELALGVSPQAPSLAKSEEAVGKARFGVVTFRAEVMDWFQLKRDANQRAWFEYRQDGGIDVARWISP